VSPEPVTLRCLPSASRGILLLDDQGIVRWVSAHRRVGRLQRPPVGPILRPKPSSQIGLSRRLGYLLEGGIVALIFFRQTPSDAYGCLITRTFRLIFSRKPATTGSLHDLAALAQTTKRRPYCPL